MAAHNDCLFGWWVGMSSCDSVYLLLHETQKEEKELFVWNQQKEHTVLYGRYLEYRLMMQTQQM